MDKKRSPIENEVPKYKKKTKKKGQPRADHKHEYKKVVLHFWRNNPFKQGAKNEHEEIREVCMICGRIGTYITSCFFGLDNYEYDASGMEHWYVNDYFDKFAKRKGYDNE